MENHPNTNPTKAKNWCNYNNIKDGIKARSTIRGQKKSFIMTKG